MGRIVIAAPSSGTGKTSICLGLLRAFARKGLRVQPFKTGPDYIDPAFHQSASGQVSCNLDLWLQPEAALLKGFHSRAQHSDIAIVEGVMGLYDGLGFGLDNGSTAHVARVLNAPVMLVIDGRGTSASAAALVKGFQDLDPRIRLSGVIVNQVSGEKHYEGIREAIEFYTGVTCVGWVKKDTGVQLESRHLGLVPSVETPELDDKLNRLADLVSEGIQLDAILEIAGGAPPMDESLWDVDKPAEAPPVQIAYGLDQAFNFYYQDNLDLLRQLGVQWVPFSPMQDSELPPNVEGLYLGGGFPEVFAEDLEANQSMRTAIQQAIAKGLPVFAECGGFMYLMESLQTFEGKQYQMCGALKGTAIMTQRLQRFGYVDAEILEDSPLGPKGTRLRGHEFHRSIRNLGDQIPEPLGFQLTKGSDPSRQWECGANTGNVLAAYCHVHFASNPEAAAYFVERCRQWGQQNREARHSNE